MVLLIIDKILIIEKINGKLVNQMRDDDVALWLAGDMVGDEISKVDSDDREGCVGFFVTTFLIFMIGFSVFAISGVSWDSLWEFIKVILLPVTFDYQLFGWNHYTSAAISAGMVTLPFLLIYVERFYYKYLYRTITVSSLNKFFIYRFFLILSSVIFDLFITIYTIVGFVWTMKLWFHGFFAFWAFIFSIK